MIKLTINGEQRELDADPSTPLLWAIRDLVGLTGTKYGCGIAECGACTVHVDGKALRACITPLAYVAGKQITTIEGLNTPAGKAVTVTPARSCRPRACWRKTRSRQMKISPTRCAAISAAVAPITESARQSDRLLPISPEVSPDIS